MARKAPAAVPFAGVAGAAVARVLSSDGQRRCPDYQCRRRHTGGRCKHHQLAGRAARSGLDYPAQGARGMTPRRDGPDTRHPSPARTTRPVGAIPPARATPGTRPGRFTGAGARTGYRAPGRARSAGVGGYKPTLAHPGAS